jgi:hypothetical protein
VRALLEGPFCGMGSSIFCGVAQIVVRRFHKPDGGGASPPATSIFLCSQHRRAAEPYKLGRPGRLPGTAGLDTQDYNQTLPVARGKSGTVLRTRIAVVRLHSRVPIPKPTPTDHRPEPSEGSLCECSTHSVGANCAVEAHRDVQRIGNAQAAGANPAIGTRRALQALTAERRTRNPEVDRAIRSWGTKARRREYMRLYNARKNMDR